jgi:hypothetical protein
VVGEFFLKRIDQRPRGVRLADRDAMKPDHVSTIVFEFGIVAEALAESARVLLPPQQK